jgi:hypothetical protein
MATTTVTLEPQDIAGAVKSLKTEFAKAKITGVKTITKRGAVYVEMPITGLAEYKFSSTRELCSWKTPRKKIVIRSKGFAIEQQTYDNAFHVIFKVANSESKTASGKKTSAIRRIFFQRSLRAIEELQSLDESKLAEAVQAPTDYSVLVSALNTEEALASIRTHDPLGGARLRGLEARRKLVEAEGGALSTTQMAGALGITRQAVDKRRKERKLLGVELGRKGFLYPAWQVGLPHLQELLGALEERDGWEQVSFFLNPSALLDDRTPLEVLKGGKPRIEDVLHAAAAYGEQGA